jgi:O-antigen/teichoic acid export membrane protein
LSALKEQPYLDDLDKRSNKVCTVHQIKKNLTANALGQGWSALTSLIVVPLYLHFVGAEGFGLIGFFATLCATLAILDGGLGATVTRESATLNQVEGIQREQLLTTLRTIETIFWGIAAIAGLVVALLAPFIASDWMKISPAEVETTTDALRLMGAAVVLQFPVAFYSGSMVGQQRQVRLNVIGAVATTARALGAVIVLWILSPTVAAFFAWQCIVGILTLIALYIATWRSVDTQGTPRFKLASLRRTGRFTVGVGAINVLALLLTQTDKIVLSKVLPLQYFGYYMVAWTAGTVALRLTGPIFNAYYPHITQLVSRADSVSELLHDYMRGASLMATAVVPLSLWITFFGRDLLLFWTRDQNLAAATHLPLAFICIGTMFNALMHFPYALQLAQGRTKIPLVQNIIASVLVVPMTVYLAERYSLPGAALPWLLLNLGYMLFAAPLMYRTLLSEARRSWCVTAVAKPIIVVTAITVIFYLISTFFEDQVGVAAIAASSLIASYLACARMFGWKLMHVKFFI